MRRSHRQIVDIKEKTQHIGMTIYNLISLSEMFSSLFNNSFALQKRIVPVPSSDVYWSTGCQGNPVAMSL
jgi:hypothetical protein